MELKLFDHILVAILLIVLPVIGVSDFRRLKTGLIAGRVTARLSFYRNTIAQEWVLVLAVLSLWLACSRGFPQLGFGFETGRGFWIGAAITLVVCALLIVQVKMLLRDPEKLRAAVKEFEPLQAMIPRTDREAREFSALSITAGICEEILYRGYLMAYVGSAVGIPGAWPAVLLSSLVFGLGHAYQGPKGVLKTGAFGLAMAGLYVLTGSIWLIIVLHIIVDMANGSIGRQSIQACEAAPVEID